MERMDDLQHNGLVLFQDTDLACFNADALRLVSFLRLNGRDRVVELGSGTGVICTLGAEKPARRLPALKSRPVSSGSRRRARCITARKSALSARIVAQAPALLGRGAFTAAVMNPPYFTNGDKSSNRSIALSPGTKRRKRSIRFSPPRSNCSITAAGCF
jgi:tRNA1(Val) A37 N6-methylase TrmN6